MRDCGAQPDDHVLRLFASWQVKKGKSPVELRKTNLGIVSTFADASLDMPIHRYSLVYTVQHLICIRYIM